MDNILKSLKGSEILITGGAGFIGSNLAIRLVEDGCKVSIIDRYLQPFGANDFNLLPIRNKIHLVKQDIRSKNAVRKLVDGKDFIFHLAAQTSRTISLAQPKIDLSINILGTLNVLEAINVHKNKAKLIFNSSRGVIGKPNYLPVDEKHPPNPRDFYAIHKLTAERYCSIFAQEYGTRSTILRPNNVYGPRCQVRSNHYGTINLFIKYALCGEVLPIYGNGKQTREYLYVDDMVSALITATAKEADGDIYIVGTGKEHSLVDIANIIKKYIKNASYKLVPYPTSMVNMDFGRFYSTSKKFTQHLGWESVVGLEEGIKKTIDYYKKYLPYYI